MNFVAQPIRHYLTYPASGRVPTHFVQQAVTAIRYREALTRLWSRFLFGYPSLRYESRILADISNGLSVETIMHIALSADSHRNTLGGHVWYVVYDATVRAREGNSFPALRAYIDQKTKWNLCKILSRETEMTRQEISDHVVLPREHVEKILSEESRSNHIVNYTFEEQDHGI